MKNILVPIDFSQEANNAVEVAIQLVEKSGGGITLLHVIDSPAGSTTINSVGEHLSTIQDNVYMIQLMEGVRERMAEIVNNPAFEKLNIKEKISFGNIFSNIEKESMERKIDLIVMGSKGTSGLDEFLIGSNTEKVVRKAKCPVLTIKSKRDPFKLENIVFATNLEEDQGIVLNKVKRFQELFHSTIHILRVNTPDHFEETKLTKRKMTEFSQRYQLENCTFNIYNSKVAEDGILSFAEETDADLIAMGTHGRTGIAHLINGSIAEDVVNHAQRLVLTVNMNR